MFQDHFDFTVAYCAQLQKNKEREKISGFGIYIEIAEIVKFRQTWLPAHTHLNKLNYAIWHRGLAEFLQVLNDVRGLQTDAHGGVERIGRQLVLVRMYGSAHWLWYGHQEVLSVFIHGRESLKEDVTIRSLQESDTQIKG